MASAGQDVQELRKMVEEGFRALSEKIQEQNEMITKNGETIKNLVAQVGNTNVKFPAPESLPGLEESDRPDEVCLCGNILMADAEYCRKCGRKRPDPPEESEFGSDAPNEEEPTEEPADTVNQDEPEKKRSKVSISDDEQTPRDSEKSDSQAPGRVTVGRASMKGGFGASKSFQEILQAETDASRITFLADRFGRRRLHFDKLRELTRSKQFLITFAVLICLNAIFTGFIADLSCRGVVDAYLEKVARSNALGVFFNTQEDLDWEMPNWPVYVDLVFAIIFTIEIGMRIVGEEFMFFVGNDWFWNNADLMLVLMSIAELALLALDVDMNVVRLVRLTRVARTVRMVRLLKFFRDLRVMLISVGHSLLPLLWATLFLSILLSVFAVIFMLACTNYMETAGPMADDDPDDENTEIVRTITTYFNTFPMTFQSLFMSITGGVSWWELEKSLQSISLVWGIVYLFFILFTILAVLNIITAIFVESATALAQTDKDLVTQRQQEQTTKYIAELRDVFLELDTDGGGTLTLEEFEERADDPQVIAYFQALEIDAMKATDFFKLFDIDGSGELEIEEFVAGCMRIKGGAKAVDIETIMHENQKLMSKFKEFFDRSARGFARIERMVQAMYQHMFAKFTDTDEALLQLKESQMDMQLITVQPKETNGSSAAGWVI